jgi:hypothetical protein
MESDINNMTGKHNECKSCGSILTIERLIGPKVGTEIDVCLQCLIAAFEEVLREQKILPSPLSSHSEEKEAR